MAKIDQYLIDQVVYGASITGYLKQHGYEPQKVSSQMSSYKCPLPQHEDKTPSFFVYTRPGQYENFYCFGCGACGTIIDLNANMNGLSWANSFQSFSQTKGLDTSKDGKISYTIKSLRNQKKKNDESGYLKSIEQVSYIISTIGHSHMKDTQYDEQQMKFLQSLYKKTDQLVNDNDQILLNKMYQYITGDNQYNNGKGQDLFQMRFDKWKQRKNESIRNLGI